MILSKRFVLQEDKDKKVKAVTIIFYETSV